ncbi:hypothetical protein BC835DRAFT_1517654 [Cytidiella melzeri]|nr:hypothetical protein BC835DRAFT_1517654 [Cytidiella melzeri]
MSKSNHARRVHRLKKRSPTSLDIPFPIPTDIPLGPLGLTSILADPVTTTSTPEPVVQPTTSQQPQISSSPAAQLTPASLSPAASSSTASSQTPTSSAAPTSSSTTTTSSTQVATSTQATKSTVPAQLGPVAPSVASTTHTSTFHSPSSSASSSAISDAATNGASTSHTGTIVGIAAGVIVGIIAVIFLSTYFLRRRARRNSEDEFSAEVFKRQSMVLPDETFLHSDRKGAGAPTMVEQRMDQDPVSYGGVAIYSDRSFYGGQSSFGPGQIVTMPPQAWTPGAETPNSAHPFYNPMGETPAGSPITPSPYDSFFNAQGQLVRQPSNGSGAVLNHLSAAAPAVHDTQAGNGTGPMLSRQPSAGPMAAYSRTPSPGPAVALNRQPSSGPAATMTRQPSPGPAVMLNRQPSVGANNAMNQSPFGADAVVDDPYSPITPPPAAYVTRQAPVENPFGNNNDAHYVDLNRSSVSPFQAAQYEEISSRLKTSPPRPLPTPQVAAYAEEALANDAPVVTNVSEPRPLNVASSRASAQGSAQDEDDSLSLPSPAFSGKARINSIPPTLPEIGRPFSPVTMEFPVAPTSVQPSPLSTSFTVPSPSDGAHFKPANPDTPTVPGMRPARQETPAKRPDTVYTLYDDDDAYAGI